MCTDTLVYVDSITDIWSDVLIVHVHVCIHLRNIFYVSRSVKT